jgi:O-antigen ligase
LFIFTLPLDTAELSFLSEYLSVAKIFGLLFFAFYFFYYFSPQSYQRFLFPPRPVRWFAGYVAVYAVNGLFMDELSSQFFQRLMTLIQLVLFFWAGSNLLKEEKLTREALLAYALAAVLVALGVVVEGSSFSAEGGARATTLGEDPNNQAVVLALAVQMLMGLHLAKSYRFLGSRMLFPTLVFLLLVAIVYTGSRTGFLALIIGFLPYLLMKSRARMTAVGLVVLTLMVAVQLAVSNPMSSQRWSLAFQEGSLAGREKITWEGMDMVLERPLLGWKPVEFWAELGRRHKGLWEQADAHNLYLHLLLEVGAVGTFPFLVGLWLCTRSAWRVRTRTLGSVPLALMLTILVATLGLTWVARKPLWFVLALCLGAELRILSQRRAATIAHRNIQAKALEGAA